MPQTQEQKMNQLKTLRQEFVTDADSFELTHTGSLQWINLIQENGPERIDRLTYTTDTGVVEHVLSVQVRLGTTLAYFAEEFGDADALVFLAIQSQDLIDRLQQRREQELAADQPSQRMAG